MQVFVRVNICLSQIKKKKDEEEEDNFTELTFVTKLKKPSIEPFQFCAKECVQFPAPL
jgi:hypothetical protein